MHIHNVSLQVSLQVASVATITTFEVFQLKIEVCYWRLEAGYSKKILNHLSFDQCYFSKCHLNVLLVDMVPEVCELPEAVGTPLLLLLLHLL